MTTEHLDIQTVQCCCRAGASLPDCIREAIALAMESEQRVVFTHNNREYTADAKEIIAQIFGQHPQRPEKI